MTGLNQKVGNYPGVTVEKHVGRLTLGDREVQLVDLPGVYSLAAHSPDELIALDMLLGRIADLESPDAVLVLVDATNLTRNLFLVTQLLELSLPVVIALNMMDRTPGLGLTIDSKRLGDALQAPVVEIVASAGQGLDRLKETLVEALAQEGQPSLGLVKEIKETARSVASDLELSSFDVERALIDVGGAAELRLIELRGEDVRFRLVELRRELAVDQPLAALEARERYSWISECLRETTQKVEVEEGISSKIESFVAHPLWGSLLFVGLMATIFQAVFSWATPLMDLIDGGFGGLGAGDRGMASPRCRG